MRLAISTTETLTDLKTDLVVANNNNYNHAMSAVTSQSLSTTLTVISENIEGLTAAKASILSEM